MHCKAFLTTIALVVFAVTPVVNAQQTTPQQQPQDLPDIEVNDQELRSIAEAYVEVQNLTASYSQQINAAADAETAREIQKEYAQVTTQAIQDEGLTVDRYDTVIQVASADQALGDRLIAEIEGVMNEQEGNDTDS